MNIFVTFLCVELPNIFLIVLLVPLLLFPPLFLEVSPDVGIKVCVPLILPMAYIDAILF
jgi:hypothetical protein